MKRLYKITIIIIFLTVVMSPLDLLVCHNSDGPIKIEYSKYKSSKINFSDVNNVNSLKYEQILLNSGSDCISINLTSINLVQFKALFLSEIIRI